MTIRKLHVNLGKNSYDILIEPGILSKAHEYITYRKIAIITDETVDKLYGDKLISSLKGEIRKLVLPAGETSKSFDTLKKVYDFLLDFQITRSDCIIAFGGGVMGDLAGFAASTVLRGIPFIQIPTTLLAQVDSSVGGKVAINAVQGKNLIGSFYQPKLVLVDTDCLNTLSPKIYADGMAEVIKYGCIADEAFFTSLENGAVDISEVVETCCNIKRKVVEVDEHDTGLRMILNFGHTIGHAVEQYYHYEKYTHGEGVAIGMMVAAKVGEALGITPVGVSDRIKNILIKYNLPYTLDVNTESLIDAIKLDKKSDNDKINIILLNKIGSAVIHKIAKADFFEVLKA